MVRMMAVALAGSDLGELLGDCRRSAHAHKRLEAVLRVGAALALWYESAQGAVGASVGLLDRKLYLGEYLLWHNSSFRIFISVQVVIVARSDKVGSRSRLFSVLPCGCALEKRDFQKFARYRKLGAVDLEIWRGYLKKDSPGGMLIGCHRFRR